MKIKFRIVRIFQMGYTRNMGKRRNKKEKLQKVYKNRSEEQESTYSGSQEIKWGKLDNTAHLFPVIAGEGMSNVYRVSITLKEDIEQEKLQQALDIVLPKFSIFNCRLRQGMFWYYFEENGKQSPRVVEENTYPC